MPGRVTASARRYLTIRLAAVLPGTGVQTLRRPMALPQLTAREAS
jgi:hypothetical protein